MATKKTQRTKPEPKPDRSALVGRMSEFKTGLPGYWTTRELATFCGMTRDAVNMHVYRGNLKPLENVHVQTSVFSDEEVCRWLISPGRRGRPVSKEQQIEAQE